jgi:aryl-alcohol dehydrogenase-like predicted oxidoreductase
MTDFPRVNLAPGYSIANIINGCWQLSPGHGGGPSSARDMKNRFAELVDHGLTTFDCADIYTGTEELLGEFRRSLSDSDQIQIHTKFVPNKESLGQLNDRKIDAAIDLSRKKLGVDRLDLVQFHWWDYDVPGLERMYERLLFAQSNGKIRLLGVTNFNTERLQKLIERDAAIVSVQTQFSLVDRRPEQALSPFCVENHVGMLAYGVLAGGFVSENFPGRPLPGELNRSQQKYRLMIDDAGGWETFQTLLVLLDDIAKKHNTNMQAIASRWVLDQPGVAAIVLGIGSRSRAAENQAIAAIDLDAEDRQRLNQHLATQHCPEGDPYDLERDTGSEHYKIIRTDLQDSAAQ